MGWKIYFWIITPLIVAYTGIAIAELLGFFIFDKENPLLDEPWGWLDWLETFITGISLVGLFGFTYKKTIGEQSFWKKWFIFALIFDTVYTVNTYKADDFALEGMWDLIITFSVLIVFLLPYYVALYLYGYKSDSLWNPPTNPNPL